MKDNASSYSSEDYDSRIDSVLPYYRNFHSQIIDLVRTLGRERIRWLDTGCGTGSLVQKALERMDNIDWTLCDPSEGMLAIARKKLGNDHIRYLCTSSQDLSFDKEFDIVTAVQSHHYLDRPTRKKAVENCYKALKPSGLFITFENIALSTPQSDLIGAERWAEFLVSSGKSPEEVQAHLARRGTEVFPITIEEHITLLRECGFRSVDLLWASYLQAGFFAIK